MFNYHLHKLFPNIHIFIIKTNMAKRGRKMGESTCDNCGVLFHKPISEIKRNKEIGRKNFCSRTCVGQNNSKHLLNVVNKYDISKHSSNRKDEFTKFRYHLRNIISRTRERNLNINITANDLKEQWELQKGICVFTGVNLEISTYTKIKKNPIYSASIDRIDSSLGYVKGNIRWISRAMNWMKNEMTDEMTWELIKLIQNKKGS